MTFENDLHDWSLDGIALGPSEITLDVHFNDVRKRIKLRGARRCLLNNFLMYNIIFEAKVITTEDEQEVYKEELACLDASDQGKPADGLLKLLCISPSLGARATIEFRDIEIRDLS